MTSPRIATWLLKRALRGPRAASVLGDIVERYHEGRSHLSFWKQSGVAIVLDTVQGIATQKWLAASAVAAGFWLMLCVNGGATGWLIARLHRGQFAMVLLFTACDLVYVGVQATRTLLFQSLHHFPVFPWGFPPALAVLLVGVPAFMVLGGILASRGDLEAVA